MTIKRKEAKKIGAKSQMSLHVSDIARHDAKDDNDSDEDLEKSKLKHMSQS